MRDILANELQDVRNPEANGRSKKRAIPRHVPRVHSKHLPLVFASHYTPVCALRIPDTFPISRAPGLGSTHEAVVVQVEGGKGLSEKETRNQRSQKLQKLQKQASGIIFALSGTCGLGA